MDVTIADKLYVIVVYVCDDITITIPYPQSCPRPLKLHVVTSMIFQSMFVWYRVWTTYVLSVWNTIKPYQFDQVFYLNFRMLYCLWFLEQEIWTSSEESSLSSPPPLSLSLLHTITRALTHVLSLSLSLLFSLFLSLSMCSHKHCQPSIANQNPHFFHANCLWYVCESVPCISEMCVNPELM